MKAAKKCCASKSTASERPRTSYASATAPSTTDEPANNSADAPVLAPVNDVVHDLTFDEAHTAIINGRHRRDLG